MQYTKLTGCGFALATVMLITAGCGQKSTTTPESASKDKAATQADVEPGSPESPANQTDNPVQHAVATAPADRISVAPGEPARLPADDGQPLTEGFDEPLPELPLEEPINSGQSMPQVYFTEAHAKTNVVGVGDSFPKLELNDLDGQPKNFGDLLGEKLTIVVFWNGKLPTATEELADMQSRFLDEFAEQGVAVVGVNVGDNPQLAKELVQQASAKYAQLSDADGAAFAKVATARMPRTYLIDTAGQILWFDIEYSRTTRQELLSALRFLFKAK